MQKDNQPPSPSREAESIVFATNNAHKLDEVRAILKGTGLEILSLSDIGCHEDIPEDADTLEGNAMQKARYIKEHYGYDCFCSTLTLSRHKDAVRINALGEELARMTGVAWLPSDFKKRDRENRSIELCEQYGVYRQLYCGCEFSLHHRQAVAEEKAALNSESSENTKPD